MSPGIPLLRHTVAQTSRTPVEVFDQIYLVFLVLGTLVGTVVISYTVYNAYKYRTQAPDEEGRYDIEETDDDEGEEKIARPQVGEIPTGAGKGGGKKLFVSFAISAVIVLSLIVYAYTLFLYVEDTDQLAEGGQDPLEVDVTAQQFKFTFTYENGHQSDVLRVPEDRPVVVNVTSRDVMHNFGVPGLRVKKDAIPNQYNTAWFEGEETGTHEVICYELCGTGHSNMRGQEVRVMEQDEFQEWYEGTETQTAEVSD
jgi:cytochrome c oxidase subunit 2